MHTLSISKGVWYSVTLEVSLSKLQEHGMKIIPHPIVQEILKGNKNAIWIEPIMCIVEYIPSEKEGLRQPVFKGIRDDKLPKECTFKQ